MNIQENILLRNYTTFRIGGPARYFVVVQTSEEAQDALRWAQKNNIAYFILGGGSNLLFPDAGFDGLVIKVQINSFSVSDSIVSVGASVLLSELIDKTISLGLTALEFVAGIPGEVGGAVRGNAGTYGISIGDIIRDIVVIDHATFEMRSFTRDQCGFAYRHSIFKEQKNIIVSASLQLQRGDVDESKRIIAERIQTRHENHPLEPSAGCIFKNVELSKVDQSDLQRRGIDMAPFQKYQKIPTGYLIEKLELKGKTVGGAAISARHGNYIINTGTATFEDVIILISLIKQQVRDAYGIQLEEEAHIIG
jgi:UDP-N-acetylmuramate dehydrogenase